HPPEPLSPAPWQRPRRTPGPSLAVSSLPHGPGAPSPSPDTRQLVNPGAPTPSPANWRVLEPRARAPPRAPPHRALPTGKFWSPDPQSPRVPPTGQFLPRPGNLAGSRLTHSYPRRPGDPWTRANWRVPDPANWPGRVIGVLFRSFTSVLLRRFHLWTPPPTTRGPRSPVNWPAPRPRARAPAAGAAWPLAPTPAAAPHRPRPTVDFVLAARAPAQAIVATGGSRAPEGKGHGRETRPPPPSKRPAL
ncbi:hypothetical protein P168DRAFT_261380, partial [Aspergillus campestris IBT 28561]